MIVELVCKHCELPTCKCKGVSNCPVIKKAELSEKIQHQQISVEEEAEAEEPKINNSKHGRDKRKIIPPKIECFLRNEGFLSNISKGIINLRIRVINPGDYVEIYEKIDGRKVKEPYLFKNDLHLKKNYKFKFVDGRLI